MAIGKLIKGRGARGLCEYLLGERDHNGEARERVAVIGGTFAGQDARALAAEFGALHRLRPGLGVHVAHMSLRFPADERALSDGEMGAIADHWSRGMGFDGYAIIRHDDHVHIAASRIRLDGSVVSDRWDWKASERLVREIEQRFGLIQVEASHLLEPERATTHRQAPGMAEIALAEKGAAPAAEQVRDLVEAALVGGPTATEFVRRLELAGVEVLPNVASTGKLHGFAYRVDGHNFTSGGLGRGYTLANLLKRGLTYEPDRDLATLDQARARAAARSDRGADAGADRRVDGGGADHRDAAGERDGHRRDPGQGAPAGGAGDGVPVGGVAPDHGGRRPAGERVAGGGGRDDGERRAVGEGRGRAGRADDAPGVGADRPPAGRPAGGAAPAADPAPNRAGGVSRGAGADGGRGRLGVAGGPPSPVGAPAPGPAVQRLRAYAGAPADKTVRQVREQLAAFTAAGVERFEVQPIPPKGSALPMERMRVMVAGGIEKAVGWLRRMNLLGYDVYVRPAARADGNVQPLAFVDDLNAEGVRQMKADGLPFAVLVESSPGRFHGWVRLADEPIGREELTKAAKVLARRYGADPDSADWRHYGRLTGFTNQKPSRRTERGAPFAMLRSAAAAVAPGGVDVLAEARQAIEHEERAKLRAEQERRARLAFRGDGQRLGDAAAAFRTARDRSTGKDESARDFAGALALLRRGYSEDQVRAAILQASPDLDQRHRNPEDYVRRTVGNAARTVQQSAPPRPGRGPRHP